MKKESNNKKKELKKNRKILEGEVVSTKPEQTVIVKVTTSFSHPLYRKIMSKVKRFMAHSEKDLNVGDVVKIVQSKPYSKRKTWKVIDVVEKQS